jgi:hypothetical protein
MYVTEKAANLSKIAQVVLASSDSGILAGMGQNWTCRGVKIKKSARGVKIKKSAPKLTH